MIIGLTIFGIDIYRIDIKEDGVIDAVGKLCLESIIFIMLILYGVDGCLGS